jgi:hypothetical protein
MELEGLQPKTLVRLHGELLACGWVHLNAGESPGLRDGVVPQCYRATAAGRRALREAEADEG